MHKHSINLEKYEKLRQLVLKKLMAPNPSPFTLYGTGTYIVGRNKFAL